MSLIDGTTKSKTGDQGHFLDTSRDSSSDLPISSTSSPQAGFQDLLLSGSGPLDDVHTLQSLLRQLPSDQTPDVETLTQPPNYDEPSTSLPKATPTGFEEHSARTSAKHRRSIGAGSEELPEETTMHATGEDKRQASTFATRRNQRRKVEVKNTFGQQLQQLTRDADVHVSSHGSTPQGLPPLDGQEADSQPVVFVPEDISAPAEFTDPGPAGNLSGFDPFMERLSAGGDPKKNSSANNLRLPGGDTPPRRDYYGSSLSATSREATPAGFEQRRAKIVAKRRRGIRAGSEELSEEATLDAAAEDNRRAKAATARRNQKRKVEVEKTLGGQLQELAREVDVNASSCTSIPQDLPPLDEQQANSGPAVLVPEAISPQSTSNSSPTNILVQAAPDNQAGIEQNSYAGPDQHANNSAQRAPCGLDTLPAPTTSESSSRSTISNLQDTTPSETRHQVDPDLSVLDGQPSTNCAVPPSDQHAYDSAQRPAFAHHAIDHQLPRLRTTPEYGINIPTQLPPTPRTTSRPHRSPDKPTFAVPRVPTPKPQDSSPGFSTDLLENYLKMLNHPPAADAVAPVSLAMTQDLSKLFDMLQGGTLVPLISAIDGNTATVAGNPTPDSGPLMDHKDYLTLEELITSPEFTSPLFGESPNPSDAGPVVDPVSEGKRNYYGPSATSRKAVPAGFEERRAKIVAKRRRGLGLEDLTEDDILNAAVEDKRRANTVAARRSRQRKLENLNTLEQQLDGLVGKVQLWKEKAIAIASGLPNGRQKREGMENLAQQLLGLAREMQVWDEKAMVAESESPNRTPAPDGRKCLTPVDTPISGQMTAREVISQLVAHGCKDVTHDLDHSTFSEHPISRGGFSDVYCGRLRNNERVAIKALRVCLNENTKHLKHAARELHIWSKCVHPNVLQLYGLVEFRGQIGMVSPWMGQGNLSRYLERTSGVDRCDLCVQICDGLAFMHQIGIVHGDLKGTNVLISDEGVPVLIDFGNSLHLEQSMKFTDTTRSSSLTLRWSAPELITGSEPHSEASDVYALGMIIYEVMAGTVPYKGHSEYSIMYVVVDKREPPGRPESIPVGGDGDKLWNLLLHCWTFEPKARPGAGEVAVVMKTITPEGLNHVNETPISNVDQNQS